MERDDEKGCVVVNIIIVILRRPHLNWEQDEMYAM